MDAYHLMRNASLLNQHAAMSSSNSNPAVINNASSWLDSVCRLDSLCHATITTPSARKSSISQGRCMMKVCSEIFEDALGSLVYSTLMQRLSSFDDLVMMTTKQVTRVGRNRSGSDGDNGSRGAIPGPQPHTTKDDFKPPTSSSTVSGCLYRGHYAPFFGVVCGVLGLTADLAQTMFLRCTMRDALSAACRLNILGPLQAAKLQLHFSHILPTMLTAETSRQPVVIARIDPGSGSVETLSPALGKRKLEPDTSHEEELSAIEAHKVDVETVGVVKPEYTHESMEHAVLPLLSQRAANVMRRRRALQQEFPSASAATSTAPVLDLIQSQHDQLYSRLFIS